MVRVLSMRDAALRRAQEGGACERADFIKHHHRFIQRRVCRRAQRFAHLVDPEDLTQEVFCALMDPAAPRYDPSLGDCGRYLDRLLYDVLAYRRRRWRAAQRGALRAHDAAGLSRRRGVWREGARLEGAAGWLTPQASRVDAETALTLVEVVAAAPLEVRAGLRAVFMDGETQRTTAARLGLTPSTFCRRMQTFYITARERLAA